MVDVTVMACVLMRDMSKELIMTWVTCGHYRGDLQCSWHACPRLLRARSSVRWCKCWSLMVLTLMPRKTWSVVHIYGLFDLRFDTAVTLQLPQCMQQNVRILIHVTELVFSSICLDVNMQCMVLSISM